jgi:hypothetical protein
MTGVKGRAMWRCEFCGVENEIGSDVLMVHHLDGNKWNLSPWNLATRCHREVQWTIDFYQANLTGLYPGDCGRMSKPTIIGFKTRQALN